MAKYNGWKLMDKITVAVRAGDESYRGFTGYVVEAGDEEALKKAKDWARTQTWDPVQRKHVTTHEPKVYTFDNEGFTARVMESAGGSSQGGRLSFWMCEVEKDGVKFRIGVNDAILADLIRGSDLSKGLVKQKVRFARQQGQPGLIHEGMDSWKEANADMQRKADMKAMKKTKKWEIGGIYQSITQTSICLGEVFDTMEEHVEQTNTGWYGRTQTVLRKRDTPVKTTAWIHIYRFQQDEELPETFGELLKNEIGDRRYVYFYTGTPPARAKTGQLIVKPTDMKLLDTLLSLRKDQINYGDPEYRGRFVRTI